MLLEHLSTLNIFHFSNYMITASDLGSELNLFNFLLNLNNLRKSEGS